MLFENMDPQGTGAEASKGGMKAGRIKDPLYKDYYLGISQLPSPYLLKPQGSRKLLVGSLAYLGFRV